MHVKTFMAPYFNLGFYVQAIACFMLKTDSAGPYELK